MSVEQSVESRIRVQGNTCIQDEQVIGDEIVVERLFRNPMKNASSVLSAIVRCDI